MPYELTLRPKSATPIEPESLRENLLAQGLTPRQNTCPPGLLADDVCLYGIVSDLEIPAGVCVQVKMSFGLGPLEMVAAAQGVSKIARDLDSEVMDGRKVLGFGLDDDIFGDRNQPLVRLRTDVKCGHQPFRGGLQTAAICRRDSFPMRDHR